MCSPVQRDCDHSCSGKFRRDRREISGTVRGTQLMPVTLAVFGNQQFRREHNCGGNTWTGIRRLVGRPVPAIFAQTRSGSQRRGRSFGAPSWNAAEPAIGRAVAEKAIGVGNKENVMSSSEGPERRPVIPARQARQGVTGHNVRFVLGFSIAAVVIVFAIIWIVYFT